MNEDFVPYELAIKLKEKGFTCEYPFAMYNKYEQFCPLYSSDKYYFGIDDFDEHACIAPTISQVLKWLREKKDIDLVISPVFFYDDVLGKMREYGCKVFTPSLNKPEHCGYHEKWEQAALAGIEYCLDNLI